MAMGMQQLKETLRRLCVEIGWSYAVFWRAISRNNQMHLVWGDGHCERPPSGQGLSGFEAMDLLLKERVAALRNNRDGLFAEFGYQAADRVGSLVYKLMASEIHVVGDGIVGQAALTGNHQWILQGELGDYGFVPKALEVMNHQFSSGIQTIAIIPVLPHGVLQLGSTQMVMENIGFINNVRSLFMELVSVPDALVSDVTQKQLSQNILLNESLEVSSSRNQSGDFGTYVVSNNQLLQASYSRPASQPYYSFRHSYSSTPANASNISSTTATSTMIPLSDFSQPTVHPVVEPIRHHSQLKSRSVGSQSIPSDPDVRSIENTVLPDSSSASQHQSHIPPGLSSKRLTLLKEQLVSLSGSQESAKIHRTKLDDSATRQLMLNGCTSSSSHKDLDTVFPLGQSESLNNNDLVHCSSLPSCTERSVKSQYLIPSNMEVPHMLDPKDHSKNSEMLSGDPLPRCSTSIQSLQTVPTERQQRNDDNLFQTLDLDSTIFEEQQSRHGLLLGTLQDDWQSSLDPLQESKRTESAVSVENHASAASSQNIMGIDNSTPLQVLNTKKSLSPVQFTSGNDWFHLFEGHKKSEGFHGSLHDVFVQCNNVNAHELSSDVSTCVTQLHMGTISNTLNEEICCNGLLSEAGPDQLLDAVVSQINSAAKQNLDDNVSCKTSLTKASSSSLHTNSAACGLVGSSEQMNVECLGISPMHAKSETAGSSSVKSGYSMDKIGACSQNDGGYKSQISLWVENGQNVDGGSISAAYGKNIDDVGKSNKKRSRPGENPRPRPKDRQMIQDRVKELREIVPNGAKCSIDALLEKTIKHMLFLQSVTKHADKLKEVGEPKIVSKEGGLLLKDNFEGGATWAFEIGTQSMICPIIVEDLNPPRQMLVEMLCEERGLFLEIADLIRGLGLTILKGVLEAREDKVWARFAVEANRDVTRIEIFLSLVHLLEPNAASSMVPQGIESLNMPHNDMFRPFSTRAAGLSECLR